MGMAAVIVHALLSPRLIRGTLPTTRKMSTAVKMEYDPKGMPFRRLGGSGLRVPLFSLGGCKFAPPVNPFKHFIVSCHSGLTLGGTVVGDPVKVRSKQNTACLTIAAVERTLCDTF